MAAEDKLIPTAITIANNLHGVKRASNNYGLPGKKATAFQNPYTFAVDFFASIYAKELRVATGDPTWNHKLVDGENLTAIFTPNRNIHDLTLGMIVAFSELEWDELQIAISKCFNIIYPFDISGPWSNPEILAYNNLMGVFSNGTQATHTLLGADGSNLGTFNQGINWANAWNTTKVNYDLSIGIITPFIAPIHKKTGTTKFYYRYTGARRWFGFQGYDLV